MIRILLALIWLTFAGVLCGAAVAQERRVVRMDGPERLIAAGSQETVDMVFRDGASLLLGPGGAMRVSADERISIALERGIFRISTGQPGIARRIDIATPVAALRLTGGAALIDVARNRTDATVLVPGTLQIHVAGGRSRNLYRPEFRVKAEAGRVSRPRRADPATLARDLGRVSPGLGRMGTSLAVPSSRDVASAGFQVLQAASTLPVGLAASAGAPAEGRAEDADASDCNPGDEEREAACLSQTGLREAARTADRSVTTGMSDFGDGFDGLGFADLDEPGTFDVVAVAEDFTSISEGATTDLFQEMTNGFVVSEDFFFGDITTLFTGGDFSPPAAEDPGTLLPSGIGPRRFGPTTNTVLASANWEVSDGNSPMETIYRASVPDRGGLSYLAGNPAISLDGARILAIRPRDDEDNALNGLFNLRGFSGVDGLFEAIRVQEDELATSFITEVLPPAPQPALAHGLSYGMILNSSASADNYERGRSNFIFAEIVDAVQSSFDSGTLSNAPEVLNFIGETPPELVRSEEVVIGEDGTDSGGDDALPLFRVTIPDPASQRRAIFAAGDLDDLVNSFPPFQEGAPYEYFVNDDAFEAKVERFSVASSVQSWFGTLGVTTDSALPLPDPDAPQPAAVTRSFLRADSWTELAGEATPLPMAALASRGLYVVYPGVAGGGDLDPGGSTDGEDYLIIDQAALNAAAQPGQPKGIAVTGGAVARLFHADMGLVDVDGVQVSSISATIGELRFRAFIEDAHLDLDAAGQPLPNISVDAIATARTIGSSNAGTRASTLLSSDWVTTASGAGAPDRTGPVDFLVLENAGLTFDDIGGDRTSPLSGGIERPLGVDAGIPDRRFGALRLAVAHPGDSKPMRGPGRFGSGLSGYAAALVEFEKPGVDEIGITLFSRAGDGPNLLIDRPRYGDNTIGARLAGPGIGFGHVVDDNGSTAGFSAFVDDLTWGALATDAETDLKLISAEPVARALRGRFRDSAGDEVPVPAKDSVGSLADVNGDRLDNAHDYVQWGFFFGDRMKEEGAREHVHLGSFAAGRPISENVLDGATGIATYRGHAVGNVYNAGDVYSAVGTFEDRFDFGKREGWAQLDFDRRSYNGRSRLQGGVYGGQLSGGDRIGRLNGRFVGEMSGGNPTALVGAFELQNAMAAPGAAYRATGTFAGEK